MTTLIDRVTDGIVQLVKHPVSAASYGFGMARGAASAAIRAASGGSGPAHAEWVAPAAEQRLPAEPGESFATEPTAVTRASAHGRGGADADIDDWYNESFLDDAPTGVVASLEFGDEFAEPADEKAILSEAETLRRAAERPGESG